MPLSLPSVDPVPLLRGLYTTDAFHRNPLFVVTTRSGLSSSSFVVRTWNEAYALHGSASLDDVNPAYVAAFISGYTTAHDSPYLRIKRLPRHHHVFVDSEGCVASISPFDPFSGGLSSLDGSALHGFLRQCLIDQLANTLHGYQGPFGCEQSSGLDSNAVLGALCFGLNVDPARIHTCSVLNSGEAPLIHRFREYYRLVHPQCHDIPSQQRNFFLTRSLMSEHIKILGMPSQLYSETESLAALRAHQCKFVFSGFGGDQGISHNAVNVPTDLVASGRWRDLVQWMGGFAPALRIMFPRLLGLVHRPWAERKVLGSLEHCGSYQLLQRTLTPTGVDWIGKNICRAYPWELDPYVSQKTSIRRRVLADWIAVRVEDETRLAAAYGISKSFPLLNEFLIGSVLAQNPLLFGERHGHGRLIHRRAFEDFLPPLLVVNPSKQRDHPEGLDQWVNDYESWSRSLIVAGIDCLDSLHQRIHCMWDVDAICGYCHAMLNDGSSLPTDWFGARESLLRLVALSDWLIALDS